MNKSRYFHTLPNCDVCVTVSDKFLTVTIERKRLETRFEEIESPDGYRITEENIVARYDKVKTLTFKNSLEMRAFASSKDAVYAAIAPN